MLKGIDIRYATRPSSDDKTLMDLRQQLRQEEDRHQTLQFKLNFLGDRLQAALDAGRADNAAEAAKMFARLKEDLAIRFKMIVDLNREIATLDPRPKAKAPELTPRDPEKDDALISRVLSRIENLTQSKALPC
ncbi:hypothetical protein SAMN04488515_2131 [Cognatiyoonia koreensis]|uniref:Uncharacterized protein n=1 Tax=Cognatiyoonia koreensis TaxID=364200 RepID=A0A1I0QRU9_9RHOB|nr:hypothetical protein [Cognatiyoonia koreensis]SEW30089.1 hypothetical protein SAMN04488515_2131 [Cognatiyoonia koreensis]